MSDNTRKTISEKLFDYIMEDKSAHRKVLMGFDEEKRDAIMGRKGKIIVAGPEGGLFNVHLTPVGIFKEDEISDIRNEIYMTDDTLIEILIWLCNDPHDPGMSPREARVHGLIKFKGEHILYDSEEIFSALEKYAFEKVRPLAKSMLGDLKNKAGV